MHNNFKDLRAINRNIHIYREKEIIYIGSDIRRRDFLSPTILTTVFKNVLKYWIASKYGINIDRELLRHLRFAEIIFTFHNRHE